ncbi:hypothetical protein [Vibrio sp. MA40-2]|uniref:hypothetical protein n=1 Tax=Vibrio sp. MA40-2 TaxID=3391828 RepID=UPI0039A72F76
MSIREKLIVLLGGVPVKKISTRTGHLPYFDYLVVRHRGAVQNLSEYFKLEPILTIYTQDNEHITVIPNQGQNIANVDRIFSVEKIARNELWYFLAPYFQDIEKRPVSVEMALSMARKIVCGTEAKHAHQLSYDLLEALHNYPCDTTRRVGVKLQSKLIHII